MENKLEHLKEYLKGLGSVADRQDINLILAV